MERTAEQLGNLIMKVITMQGSDFQSWKFQIDGGGH